MVPFSASISFLLITSPKPVPPNSRVVPVSTWEKLLNRRFILLFGMPLPVSLILKRKFPGFSESVFCLIIRLTVPCSVNLIELPIRFIRICFNLAESVITHSGMPGSISNTIFSFLADERGWSRFTVSSAVFLRFTLVKSSSSSTSDDSNLE